MNNWFEVGEEIVLRCKDFPEYDGDYTIEKILDEDEDHMCRLTGRTIYYGGVTYLLNTPLLEKDSWQGNEVGFGPWSIFKKHKPSDESFKDMMQNIKSSVRVVEGVV